MKTTRFGRRTARKFISPRAGSTNHITNCRERIFTPCRQPAANPAKITTIDLNTQFGPGGGALSLSPDGKQVAFVAATNQPINSYTEPDLWVLDLSPNAKPRNITANFDFDIDGFVIGDSSSPRAGGANKPIWTADGKGLIAVYAKEGKRNLGLFDATVAGDGSPGKSSTVQDLTSGNHGVISFRATPDASKLVYVISTPTRVNDLFVLDRATPGATPKQLTNVNDELFSKLNLTEPEEIWYDSFDGKRIQAWLQKPPNFDAHKKYPLILNIHGGPHVAYGDIFVHEFQWMAAKGYVVLYPNPRGSTSYGQEFGNVIQYRYPGDDYKDLMAGVDEVIKRGYIDDKKLGVTGGSGGGLLTNWVVGQTGRFAAAVSQRDIAELGKLVVHGRLHALPAELVSSAAIRRPGRVSGAVTDQLHQQCEDADDVHPRGGGLSHAARRRRRANVSRVEVPQDSNRDGAFP